jgi:hypothetical protein
MSEAMVKEAVDKSILTLNAKQGEPVSDAVSNSESGKRMGNDTKELPLFAPFQSSVSASDTHNQLR